MLDQRNLIAMANSVISAKYPPQIDVTRTPLAYGDRALPRLNLELHDANLIIRQRAVRSLCDYLHDPEHIAEALRGGIADSLKKLLVDKDVTVRQKSLECLYIMTQHAIGRDAFMRSGIMLPVSDLWDDEEDIVRKNAHMTLQMISETSTGAEGIVEAKLVKKLVAKLPTELEEIQNIILDSLHFCMRIDTADALSSDGMETFYSLLGHSSTSVRSKAARNIMDLSVPLMGKNRAVEVGCLPMLVKLLADESSSVRANAAGAIMTISITTKGKYTAIEAGALEPLVKLVDDESSETKVNALKALTCLSEAPEGRQTLQKHLDKITRYTEDRIPAIAKAAKIAVSIISWRP